MVVGGRVALSRFELTRSAVAGVQLAGGTLSLTSGRLVETPIGLNLQVPGVALEDVVADVLFVDVERNVDGMALPIPDPMATSP